MPIEPVHKRADGTVIDLKHPHGSPVYWRIYARNYGAILIESIEARTAFEAWELSHVTLPFSEVECVEVS
jgi:hypothetical protein